MTSNEGSKRLDQSRTKEYTWWELSEKRAMEKRTMESMSLANEYDSEADDIYHPRIQSSYWASEVVDIYHPPTQHSVLESPTQHSEPPWSVLKPPAQYPDFELPPWYEKQRSLHGASIRREDKLQSLSSVGASTPAHNRRKTSLSKIPRRLESYVNFSLIPFVPYLDKMDERLQYLEYFYKKPDDKWIDLGVLKTWINICDTHHMNHCRSSSTISTALLPAMPVWLIDVQNSCLVAAKRGDRYVCLSYVWGQGNSEAISMTIDNLDTLREDQALANEPVLLPRTVSHAIGLTRVLGETYLWADRLCIPQKGDDRTKFDQLNSMAEIYGNSYFTIVAAQGHDAEAGLRGIFHVTPPRQLVEPLKYQDHYEAFAVQAKRLMRSEWYHRGWTFQEHIYSRRKIIFHNDTVNWECHCNAWYENQGLLVDDADFACNKTPPSNQRDFETTSWPNFYRYARLVTLYNERSLTYPQDILDAFAGLTSVLRPTFHGGFICGLPQIFFDSALLWQPYRPLKRRKVRMSQGTAPNWPWIPSWSWIGWKGNLHSESWRSGYDYMKGNPDEVLEIDQESRTKWEPVTWRTKSTVDWRYSEDIDSQQYPINVSSQQYRAGAFKNKIGLPQGWICTNPESDKEYYQHISDLKQEFWYPIPLSGNLSVAIDAGRLRPLFLYARTRSCSLRLGATYSNAEVSQCLSCDLLDADGTWAGVLRLNLSPLSNFDGEGSECSLIEISSGSVYNQKTEAVSFDEWYRPDCPRNGGVYEFYNVLWVEDGGRVAYRKALGRVVKSVWDSCSVEVDVTLG